LNAPPLRALLLAAGYGTRLGELGRSVPKLLIPLGGRPLADHLLEKLVEIPDLAEVVVVTNSHFRDPIERWALTVGERPSSAAPPRILPEETRPEASRPDDPRPLPAVRVLDDGTSSPDERLGAVGDLAFALEEMSPEGDVLVLAADTLPGFSLATFVRERTVRTRAELLLVLEEEGDPERLGSRGVVATDGSGRIVDFQEKPDHPASNLTALPIYLFRQGALPRIPEYLATGGSRDAPGHLVAWLVDRIRVEGWHAPGPGRLDVGTPEGLREARGSFREPGRD